uniref:Sorbitol dehydrogenase n=1 Tax=Gongylonema pulchrum TaxID=637853 RepID=A0A183E3K0_9BILA
LHFLIQSARTYAFEKNICSVLHGPQDMRIMECSVPKPKEDQVLVKMDTVGICGTDMHFYRNGSIGGIKIDKPFVLGHEGAGIIVELGRSVKDFKVGDRVALEPGVSCRKCHYCKSGRYHLCQNQAFNGLPPTNGLFKQYAAHDADFCYR